MDDPYARQRSVAEALEREHTDVDAELERVLTDSTDESSLRAAVELLRRHIYVEEQLLFPPLRATGMIGPLLVMEREHGEIWTILDGLEASLSRGAALGDLAKRCATLLALLSNHNAKEEPIVYPQATALLTETQADDILAVLATGSRPEGWTCSRA